MGIDRMMQQNFSVSMSVYGKDNARYFEEALKSVFSQTVEPTEVVLVVDGPVPREISRVVEEMKSKYDSLRVFYLKENVGHGESRKLGLEKCTYELVAIMDSDDICVPHRFEKQLRCFKEDKDLSVVGGYIWEFEDEINNIIGVREVPLEDQKIKQYLKLRSPFNQQTVMFRKGHVEKAGGFLDWYCDEDYYLWIRMFLSGCKFRNLAENLVFVRMNDDSYLRRGGLRYFKSEAALQKYMYDNKMIGVVRFTLNVLMRFVIQVLIPNRMRKYIFNTFFRTAKE